MLNCILEVEKTHEQLVISKNYVAIINGLRKLQLKGSVYIKLLFP